MVLIIHVVFAFRQSVCRNKSSIVALSVKKPGVLCVTMIFLHQDGFSILLSIHVQVHMHLVQASANIFTILGFIKDQTADEKNIQTFCFIL
jgi:hypothetical protein